MDSDFRHPKHDEMAELAKAGLTNKAIARELRVAPQAVARVRRLEGIPAVSLATSEADKLNRFCKVGPDGHTLWTGRRNKGVPVIRHRDRDIPAAAVAFARRTGRKPVGICRAECGVPRCLTSSHVLDDIERRTLRGQERALYGLDPQPWDVCPKGHGWDAEGRFEPDLTAYCKACTTDRARRTRPIKSEDSSAPGVANEAQGVPN